MNAAERKLVQEPCEAKLVERGWIVDRTEHVSERGWPDTTAHRNGFCMYIEFKAPGEKCSPNQLRVHRRLRRAGMLVIVAEKWEDIEPHA